MQLNRKQGIPCKSLVSELLPTEWLSQRVTTQETVFIVTLPRGSAHWASGSRQCNALGAVQRFLLPPSAFAPAPVGVHRPQPAATPPMGSAPTPAGAWCRISSERLSHPVCAAELIAAGRHTMQRTRCSRRQAVGFRRTGFAGRQSAAASR